MSYLTKIINAIKTGQLISKISLKIKKNKKMFIIKNNVIKNLQFEDKEYRRIYKKYYNIIQNRERSGKKAVQSNKVWVCWFQGIDNAPILVKKCVQSIKEKFKDKEIIVITLDNYKEYVKFPEYIEEKFKREIITYTHFSDLLRAELLAKYGGTWLDATVYCTDDIPKYILDSKLFVYKNINLDKSGKLNTVASSWFISAYTNNDIIIATRDLLFEYWKKEKKLNNYFLFHLCFKLATEKFEEEWKEIPTFNNVNPHILQFELLNKYDEKRFEQIKTMSPIHKLDKTIKSNDEDTFYGYIIKN